MLVAKADREAVPEIDEADKSCEVYQFFLLEVSAHFVVDRIGCMRLRDSSEGFGPC